MGNRHVYTVSAKNQASDFEEHRFSIGGPYTTLADARKTKEEAERLGYQEVKVHKVEDDESHDA